MRTNGFGKTSWLCTLGAWLLAGCGGATTEVADPVTGTKTNNPSSSQNPSNTTKPTNPTSPTNPTNPSAPTPPAPTKFGSVYLSSFEYTVSGTQVASSTASAAFIPQVSTDASANPCDFTTQGNCTLTVCDLTSYTGTTPVGPQTVSAGVIDIVGGLQNLKLQPQGGAYAPFSGQQKLWKGGETIKVSASGGEAPAFKMSAAAPSLVTVTSPSIGYATPLVVARNKALNFTWKDGVAGDVQVTLMASTTAMSTSIQCLFPASSGKGTVSAQTLSQLPANATNNSVSLMSISRAKSTAQDYEIYLVLNSMAVTSSGVASGPIYIQ